MTSITNSQNLLARQLDSIEQGRQWKAAKTPGVLFHVIRKWYRNIQTRRELVEMSDYLLKDIGITRFDALKEAEKPFWKD